MFTESISVQIKPIYSIIHAIDKCLLEFNMNDFMDTWPINIIYINHIAVGTQGYNLLRTIHHNVEY